MNITVDINLRFRISSRVNIRKILGFLNNMNSLRNHNRYSQMLVY